MINIDLVDSLVFKPYVVTDILTENEFTNNNANTK